MKRKQFIKQLMAAGMSRNNAAECATLAQEAERPYFKVLGDLLIYHRPVFKRRHVLNYRKVRGSIIHGTNSRAFKALYGRMDIYEVHKMGDIKVAEALEAGMSAKPGHVVVLTTSKDPDALLKGFDWPPQPQPVAGCLYAIDTSQAEDMSEMWTKENPHTADALDAIRYAVEAAMYNRQRGVLANE